jgi:hypothetical protein
MKLVAGLLIVGGIACAGLVYSGAYSMAADERHWTATERLLETMRERSIAMRIRDIEVPADLDDAARVRRGAGNYDAMCAGCHPEARPGRIRRSGRACIRSRRISPRRRSMAWTQAGPPRDSFGSSSTASRRPACRPGPGAGWTTPRSGTWSPCCGTCRSCRPRTTLRSSRPAPAIRMQAARAMNTRTAMGTRTEPARGAKP